MFPAPRLFVDPAASAVDAMSKFAFANSTHRTLSRA